MTDFAAILDRPVRVRNGDPTPLQRLERKSTIDPDGCWTWNGCVNSRGYACIGLNGTIVLAHRLSYYLHHGPIDAGWQVDHRCHNDDRTCKGGDTCSHRRCWNPDHIEAVLPAENRRRAGQGNTLPLVMHGPRIDPEIESARREADFQRMCADIVERGLSAVLTERFAS